MRDWHSATTTPTAWLKGTHGLDRRADGDRSSATTAMSTTRTGVELFKVDAGRETSEAREAVVGKIQATKARQLNQSWSERIAATSRTSGK